MKKIFSFIIISLFSISFFSSLVLAQDNNNTTPPSGFGFEKVEGVAQNAGYNPGTEVGLDQRISSFVSIFLSLLGVLFMILMIYGGYNWMTAAGDEQKIDKAKDTIRAAMIGLIIIIAAYAISIFVISRLWGAGATVTP